MLNDETRHGDKPIDTDRSQQESTESAGSPAEPWWKPAIYTLAVLAIPLAILLIPTLSGAPRPPILLYLVAVPTAIAIAVRSLSKPDWLLASFVLYIPFNRVYVMPLAPGINATNALEALLIVAWLVHAHRAGKGMFARLPFTRLVFIWGILSFGSAITALVTMGPDFVLDRLESLKRWSDQFIVFFAFVNLIRNGAMARRVCIYTMVGTLIVLYFGFDEWQEKRLRSTIESSRLVGPQLQPNDLGAFLAYGAALPAAWLLTNLRNPLVWLATLPPFYVMTRVILGTFSRGAFIALGLMGVSLLLVRGRVLFAVLVVSGISLLELAPELLPQAVTARMSQTTNEQGELDQSSQTRLILWRAAGEIMKENPLLGGGYETFPQLKDRYTEVPVKETDNHNMYLFIGSQMGIPALMVFLLIFAKLFFEGARLSSVPDRFARAIALGGGCAMAASVLAINMFGSRMVDICVTAYVWITIAVFAHVIDEQRIAAAQRAKTPTPISR